ncbi:MAG: DUF475 domain-containing protein [Candidatus Saccharimonadales bacterium]
MSKKAPLWRIYAFSTTVSVILIAITGWKVGLSGLFLVLALVALEVSLSFDNAVVNARILKRMSDVWQKVFLSVGIIIAVFGVRLLLPILLVSLAIGSSFSAVVDLALNNPDEYGHKLEEAHPMIASFGGIFLLMIFLDYFFESRKIKWIPWLETKLEKAGTLKNISPMIAVTALLIGSQLVHHEDQQTVLAAGLVGLLIYLLIHSIDNLLQRSGVERNIGNAAGATFKAGLLGFIYLEIIDASFSLDGVIGAFAITNQILIIAIGLGIGALYVRTITVHMLKRGVLDEYRYIEHGAHYAIGILAVIMLTSLKFKVPEIITGLAGLSVIIISVIMSYRATKRDRALTLSRK